MLRVIRNHRRAAHGETARATKTSPSLPVALDADELPRRPLVARGQTGVGPRSPLGEQHGFRNAQVSVIAPTGTIGLVMDCDTTGIEPDFALVKFKKLAGGGYFKIINQTVPPGARARWATTTATVDAHRRLRGGPRLARQGAGDQPRDAGDARLRRTATIERVEKSLATAFDIRFAFSRYTLGDELLPRRPGASMTRRSPIRKLDLLARLGFSRSDIAAANVHRLRDDDGRGRARSQERASRGVRLCRIPVDEMASAACLQRVTYA